MASLMPPSWNQIKEWLGQFQHLAATAGRTAIPELETTRHPAKGKLRLDSLHSFEPPSNSPGRVARGNQYYNEMVTMMTMYPWLHVDISPYTWLDAGNAELLDRFLSLAKEQEVLDRVMFGSDQMRWPETIGMAIQRIQGLDYLTDLEKAGILYDNAARFLRLDEETIARHHGQEPRSEP